MQLTPEQKESLKNHVEEYNRLAKSNWPMPSKVLEVSANIINLLAIQAGVTLESEG